MLCSTGCVVFNNYTVYNARLNVAKLLMTISLKSHDLSIDELHATN